MSASSINDPDAGFAEHPRNNSALSAKLIQSLSAIQFEGDVMHRESLHYSVTKHVHAIRESVDQMLSEVTERNCS